MTDNPYVVLRVCIEARAPLAFPTRKPGVQFQRSLDYVPGATIYGALGALLSDQPDHLERFERLRCHNAYPMLAGDSRVCPLPVTAIKPKGEKNLLCDSLVDTICWEQQRPTALIYSPTDQDGRAWETVGSAFYTIQDGNLYTRSVTQRVLTRVAINRRRGTAEDQRLYSPLVLSEVTRVRSDPPPDPMQYVCDPPPATSNPAKKPPPSYSNQPTCFLGSLVVPAGDAALVQNAAPEITHIGGRQTTGLGAVRITCERVEPETPGALLERIATLTQRFRARAELCERMHGASWSIKDATIFTVNLLSDAILLDQGWLPIQEFTEAMLAEHTGIQAKLLRSFTSTSVAGGWNVSWQRPKPTHHTTTQGSVFVFEADQSLDEAACIRLAQMQLEGIGERRPEGYGQIRICDEFHGLEQRSSDER